MAKRNRLLLRTLILAGLFGAIAFTLYTNFFHSKELIEVGDQAPNFVLTDLNGNRLELNDLQGQGVFLNFWGTWCKPCKEEMPAMERQYQQYKEQGVTVVAVNVGETKLAVEKFAARYELSFPIVIDKDSQVLDAYNIDPLPTTFLINKDGVIVEKIIAGMSEKNIASYMEKIKP